MPDERDFRIRMDLSFPPTAQSHAEQIRDLLLTLYSNVIIIQDETNVEERGYIDVERCGHNLDIGCETIARWEVGRGRVI